MIDHKVQFKFRHLAFQMIRCKKNRSNDANDISTMLAHLPHCVCSSLETVPAEQEVQEAAPVCFVIEFSGHLVQIVTVLSLYVPALHSTVDDYSIQVLGEELSFMYVWLYVYPKIFSSNYSCKMPQSYRNTHHTGSCQS